MGRYEVVERDARVNGFRIHWAEAGRGDARFLLVHGLGSSLVKWLESMPHLASGGRVIALDMPGFGKSDCPPSRYTPEWLAGGVRAFMDELGIERPVVVGNSLGGLVAAHLAAARPDRVRALALVAPALPGPPGQRYDFGMLWRFLTLVVPGVGELTYQSYLRRRTAEQRVEESLAYNCADPSRVSERVRALLLAEEKDLARRPERRRSRLAAQRAVLLSVATGRTRIGRLMRNLPVPTLFVWGSADRFVPVSVGHHWIERLPGAELVVLDGVGHNPQVEVPLPFAQTVLAFGRKLDRGAVSAERGSRAARG